jgi:hypothetical protein
MADFNYSPTGRDENGKGGIHVFGYGVVDKSTVYTLPYKEGDVVFLKFRAEVGRIESIRIKRVLMNVDVYGLASPIYVDMLNSYYTKRDFLDHAGAVVVANAYIDKQQQYITDALEIDQANEQVI